MNLTKNKQEVSAKCPICGGTEFVDFRKRVKAKCAACGSLERTRTVKLILDHVVKLRPGMQVLHFAPERSLTGFIHGVVGAGYKCFDLDPSGYKETPVEVKAFNLCKDVFDLPERTYDLVMHNHVLEHLPCNYTVVLQQLQRSVKPGGYHVFSTPIPAGRYDEDLDPALSNDERIARFLQSDHIRRFGKEDFEATLGMVFGHKKTYSMLQFLTAEQLTGAHVPKQWWTLSGAAPFIVQG
jgi:phosphoglycolate phosphatase